MRPRRSNATADKKRATDYTDKIRISCVICGYIFPKTLLALDDLYVRIELNIKLARADLLVLFETRQTHRGRVVVLLDDLGLNWHAGRVDPDFSILITSISLRHE